MAATTDLDYIHKLMDVWYPINEANYPVLKGMNEAQQLRFALGHLCLHFNKEAGQLAALLEPTDHGAALDIEAIKTQAPKMFATLMKMIQVIGMSPAEMVAATREKYESMSKAA